VGPQWCWTTGRMVNHSRALRNEGGLSARIGTVVERALVSCADAITVATESFREHLLESFPFLDPSRVHFIPNGYDPDDFPADLPDHD